MPGRLDLLTPWARESITIAEAGDVTSAIPDGWTLTVSVDKARRQWVFWTIDPEHNGSHKLRVSSSMSLQQGCFYALRHWKLTADTVSGLTVRDG